MKDRDYAADERLGGLFQPDTLLPSQYFDRMRRRSEHDGERRLMIAVLEDAVHCFMKYLRSSDPKQRQLYREAEEWIMGGDRSWFFSFENVCETLDLEPAYVRAGLVAWRNAQPRRDATSADAAAGDDDPGAMRQVSGG